MTKAILIILTLAGFASGAEMEVTDRLSVDGSSVFRNTVTINGLLTTAGSVGVGTNSLSGVRLAVIGSTDKAYSLAVGTSTNYSLTVSTGGRLQANEIYRGTYTVLDSSILDANGSIKATGIQNSGATAAISVTGAAAAKTLDYMEYTTNAAAQTAYVSNGGFDANTKLLVHLDGADGATAYTAETGQPVAFAGGAQLAASQYKFGTAAGSFNGSSSYMSVPASDDWDFGSGNFTFDCWVRFNSVNQEGTFFSKGPSQPNNGWYFYFSNSSGGTLYFRDVTNNGGTNTIEFTAPWSPSTNTWYHVALVRNSSNWYIFVDGQSFTLTCLTCNWGATITNQSGNLFIGKTCEGVRWMNGYLDEVRISKGIARWTTNFTRPASPYAPALQDYSESTIITQGSYALKGVASATDSLNKTLTRTVSPAIDLTGRTQIKFDIRSSLTGSNIKMGLRNSGITTAEITPNIALGDTWQTSANWDISTVADSGKNSIDGIIITIVNAPGTNTFYLDNMYASGGCANSDITFTSGSERMRIDGSGNVGIGTASPGSTLTLQTGDISTRGTGNGLIVKDASNGNCYRIGTSGGAISVTASTCP